MEIRYEMRTTANMKTLSFFDVLVRMHDGEVVDKYNNYVKSDLTVDKINESQCTAKVLVNDVLIKNEKYFSIKVPMLLSKKNENIKRNEVLNDLIKMVHVIKTSNNFDIDEVYINYIINKED